jgi:transcriptional regulator with XRE-family HTH domain
MERLNDVGPQIRRLRYERGWTQDLLATQLQLHGWDISREGVAKVEGGYHLVSGRQLLCLSRVFRTDLLAFFSTEALRAEYSAPTFWPFFRRKRCDERRCGSQDFTSLSDCKATARFAALISTSCRITSSLRKQLKLLPQYLFFCLL